MKNCLISDKLEQHSGFKDIGEKVKKWLKDGNLSRNKFELWKLFKEHTKIQDGKELLINYINKKGTSEWLLFKNF